MDLSEYSNMGNALLDLQVVPTDVAEIVPKYYKAQRLKEVLQRKTQLDAILNKLGIFDEVSAIHTRKIEQKF